MDLKFLEFEQPIAELEARIDALKFVGEDSELNISEEISRLRNKSESLTRSIFSNLTAWQIAQLARHPQRPYTLDYVDKCFTDFQELHGDRMYADDHSLVGGLARLDNEPVVVIGHQKGRDTKERVWRNYGMARPEGYRKGLRLMHLAEKFGLPLITLIDTPGAYPGIGAEERGQSEAIARNLFVDVEPEGADRQRRDRRGRLGRRARDRRRGPRADAPVQHLLGHLARGLREHLVEERRQGRARRRGDGHHGRAAAPAQARRRRRFRSRSAARTATRRRWPTR